MRSKIEEILSTIIHPEFQKDIITLEIVNDIAIQGDTVVLTLRSIKAKDAFIKSIGKIAEQKIRSAIPGVEKVTIQIQERSATSKETTPGTLSGVKNIIAVASGKGGVGKSTIAANLAVGLQQIGLRVALVDADIYGPSIPKMFGIEGTLPEAWEEEGKTYVKPLEVYGIKLNSIGFYIKPEDALIWRGPMASNVLTQLITECKWGDIDFMVVDLPPGTGDIHLTLVQLLPVTGVIVVTTPQDIAVADARKGVSMFRSDKIDVPVLGLVENMSWFSPPDMPDKRYHIFGQGGAERLAKEMKVDVLGQIPIVEAVMHSGEQGKPAALDKESAIGQSFHDLSHKVVQQTNERNKTMAPTKVVQIKK
jgi:ATP-binding protein involved in chromosome partitioning